MAAKDTLVGNAGNQSNSSIRETSDPRQHDTRVTKRRRLIASLFQSYLLKQVIITYTPELDKK